MQNKKLSLFLQEAKLDYHDDIPQSDEHESMHNMTRKRLWGRRGKAALDEMATRTGRRAINVSYNPSGDIDRGYVTGFFASPDRTRFVYVCMSDGGKDMYFRTAENEKDYTGGSNNFAYLTEEGFNRLQNFVISNT